jgi:twitching motility protein PilT
MSNIGPLLDQARRLGATHLHLAPRHPPCARVNGELVTISESSLDPDDIEGMVGTLLGQSQRGRLTARGSVSFVDAHEDGARFRGEIVQALGGPRVTLRFLPTNAPTLEELGCPDGVKRLAERRSGLVLVCAAPGTDATTMLTAIVGHVGRMRACHVVTIEDPIEVVLGSGLAQISQRQIGVHAPSVAVALHNALREDVDVVMASSLATREAIEQAFALATSGVLVLAASPAIGVVAAIERFVASGGDRAGLAEVLAGVVSARDVLVANASAKEAIREGRVGELATTREGATG